MAPLGKDHSTMEPCLGSEGNYLSVSTKYKVCGIHVHSVDISDFVFSCVCHASDVS